MALNKGESTINDLTLLKIITETQAGYINGENPSILFENLLDCLLTLTGSEYGFIGEIHHTEKGEKFLKTHAITNIAWDDKTLKFYNDNAQRGLEFFNLKTLFGEVITSGKPIVTNTPSEHPASSGIPDGHPPLNQFLGIPFFKGDEFLGMVGIANREDGYNDTLIEELQPFLVTCSQLISAYRSDKGKRTAEIANEAKSAFLAHMSHELRTPLNVILGHVQLLRVIAKRDSLFRVLEGLDEIDLAGKHLLQVISDILDLSKIEANQVILNLADLNIKIFLYELESMFTPLAAKNDNRLISDFNINGLFLKTDEKLLRQCLVNILSNACKYTKNGKIHFTCDTRLNNKERFLCFSVEDNGAGISEDELNKIFEPFSQTSRRQKENIEGTGLGLTITRKLCKILGGKIEVSSKVGVGSKFTIHIPLSKTDEKAA